MLLFCDSFDHYDTDHMNEKYTAVFGASISSGGREGGNCLSLPEGASIYKAFPNDSELIVGFAFNPSQSVSSQADIVNIYDISNKQCSLRINASNGLEFHTFPGGTDTLIASSDAGVISINTYQYIEIKVVFSTSSTGSVAVQLNGENVITVTGIATSSSGNNYANVVGLLGFVGFSGGIYLFDDLYVCDGSGTVNNDFLGDVAVQLLLPNGDGSENDFSQVGGTSGENYTSVNEVPPDDDSSYVYSSNPGDIDSYTMTSVGSPTAIVGVQIVASARKDDSSTRVLALGFGNSSTFDFDDGNSLTSSYLMYTQPYDENPLTSAAWTISDLDDGEIAIKVVS